MFLGPRCKFGYEQKENYGQLKSKDLKEININWKTSSKKLTWKT